MRSPSHVVVLDFDGTCTPKSQSLWGTVDRAVLSSEGNDKANRLREHYTPRALVGLLTPQEEREWFFRSMDIYMEAGLTKAQITKALRNVVRVRPGLEETLNMLEARNIPVAIVSFGVLPFIEEVLRWEGLYWHVANIYALKMLFDSSGKMTGYDQATVVLPHNKGHFSRLFADIHNVPYENILAVGDSGGDKLLGHLKINRFGIAKDAQEGSSLLDFMGEVAVTETFDPARQWLERRLNG